MVCTAAVAIARDTGIFGEYEYAHTEQSVFTGAEFFSKSMEEQLVDTLEKSLARDKAEWEKPQAAIEEQW